MTETCIRCRREVDIDSDEFSYGEATDDGYICSGCLTHAEENAIAADAAVFGKAMVDAGLAGEGVDVGKMADAEYEMREDLAQLLYDQERP